MRVLGIDPGYAIVGFGVVEYDGRSFKTIEYGASTTEPNMTFPKRLASIEEDIKFIIEKYKPDYAAVEKLFFNTNLKTGIDVAQARGVIILALEKSGTDIYEYTPLQVKQAVVGYGKADKHQVMAMTQRILHLTEIPKPDDAADALAIAICGAHTNIHKHKLTS
ncbi:MAG: crossover junction endodeoxyribonuclease RuvC [Ruminococcus sp.]|nr:crossover junction endodeoxyribonuclease RuvC [Ruminococcus sp.]